MATLIQSYEQQYSVLTADITAKIGRLKVGNEDNREHLTREIQSNFEEANDLLEQLDLESRGGGATSRVAAYRAELKRIRDEYRSVLNTSDHFMYALDDKFKYICILDALDMDTEEVYEDWNGANEQKRKLLESTERMDRIGKNLTEGYRVALESEKIGTAVLQDLSAQRETIQRARGRLRETDDQLSHSNRVLNSMVSRGLQDRFVVIMVLFIIGLVMCAGFYIYVS